MRFLILTWTMIWAASVAADPSPAGKELEASEDRSAEMVEGIDRFLTKEIAASAKGRPGFWKRDLSSPEAYAASIEPNRKRLRKILGIVDEPTCPRLEIKSPLPQSLPLKRRTLVRDAGSYEVFWVTWQVFDGVHGEGLLLQPRNAAFGSVVVVPDADQVPEELVFAREGTERRMLVGHRLAAAGLQVLMPTLISRADQWSGNADVGRWTNQPHREWVYRQAYELGRHVIGYEIAKVLNAVTFLSEAKGQRAAGKIGVVGYGEGGLIALYAAALEPRIDATLISGYFQPREQLWQEPIYRNVFGLLREFGDAEVASLIAPRPLLLEHAAIPEVTGPPVPRNGRSGAAPGKLVTAEPTLVQAEVQRCRAFFPKDAGVQPKIEVFGLDATAASGFGTSDAVDRIIAELGGSPGDLQAPAWPEQLPDPDERQKRQLQELVDHTQTVLRRSEYVRRDFWSKAKPSPNVDWEAACKEYRRIFWDDVIGRFPAANVPVNPRIRKIKEDSRWTGYEVVLDVWPEVFAWGYLLVPKDLTAGERRPVVVCQHGLEGVPEDTVTTDPTAKGFGPYQGYASRLADQGFIVYAPHNPYRGQDKFRVLQRKANPLGKSLFSIILAQHERTLEWLSGLPFVDPERIGFYGLSYGGKSAMRIPSLLDGYCLSICSADFNEWIKKNATVDDRHSYMFTGEYEMFEFDLGNTFNYAEMAALIAPRPFMVERGHHDGVAPDEWVAYEYAKVRRLYAELGLPDRTEIEFFHGPHQIHGVGTFDFLHRHLNWPKR